MAKYKEKEVSSQRVWLGKEGRNREKRGSRCKNCTKKRKAANLISGEFDIRHDASQPMRRKAKTRRRKCLSRGEQRQGGERYNMQRIGTNCRESRMIKRGRDISNAINRSPQVLRSITQTGARRQQQANEGMRTKQKKVAQEGRRSDKPPRRQRRQSNRKGTVITEDRCRTSAGPMLRRVIVSTRLVKTPDGSNLRRRTEGKKKQGNGCGC